MVAANPLERIEEHDLLLQLRPDRRCMVACKIFYHKEADTRINISCIFMLHIKHIKRLLSFKHLQDTCMMYVAAIAFSVARDYIMTCIVNTAHWYQAPKNH